MPLIESVAVCVARVPLETATSFATRTVNARDYCLVKVRSKDGVEGIGFCYAGSAGGRIAQIAVEELLAQRLAGQDSLWVEGLWHEMYQESLLQGRRPDTAAHAGSRLHVRRAGGAEVCARGVARHQINASA